MSKTQTPVRMEGIDGLNNYIVEVFKKGRNQDDVVQELEKNKQLVTADVQILTRAEYAREILVYAETMNGNQYILPGIMETVDVLKKEGIRSMATAKVWSGKLVHNDEEMRYISFDEVNTLGKTKVSGAVLGVLKRGGFIDNMFLIVKIYQSKLTMKPIEYITTLLEIKPGDYRHNAYVLATNFAPDIIGLDDVKLILLATNVGAGPLPEGVRYTLNIMLVGPPGLAKTTLGKRLCEINPRCAYITGSASTATSLLAAYDVSTREIMLGPFVVLSGSYTDFGLIVIDEAHKLKGVGELRPALEEGVIYVSKAGKNAMADTHVSTVFIMNPILNEWVPGDVMKNFPSEYDEATLSRMDAIVLVPPITSENQFVNIVKAALDKFSGNVTIQDNDLLYTYTTYARMRNVYLPDKTEDYILDKAKAFFNEMRKYGLNVDPRTAYNMVRVTLAMARLLNITEVTNDFVDFIFEIQNKWLNRMGLGADSIYYAILSESEAKFAVSLLDMMRDSCVEGCTLGDIIQYIENLMNNNEKARDAIESMMSRRGYKTLAAYIDDVILSKLREKGDIYKCRENAYCVVR
jgi:DNA replicative helicase MCM subunit Mcm2 (Cdc46/Mcm family)